MRARIAAGATLAALVMGAGVLTDASSDLGAAPTGAGLARMQSSPPSTPC
jgi:hypothetical protein